MDENISIDLLKHLLRREVELFCRRLDPLWHDISNIVDEIERNKWRAVLFGGTLRSLLITRLVHRRFGQPRDVDIVIHGPPLDILRQLFGSLISRETRFGGFHLSEAKWEFDVWPLERTWGIIQDRICHPEFGHLPNTTFLNIEAAAIDIWPDPYGIRHIYSGDDQFFKAIIDRVIEINREENPYPDLCVVRSLVLASDLGYRIGPKLAKYVANHGGTLSANELDLIQQKHYGKIRIPGVILNKWIHSVTISSQANSEGLVCLPILDRTQEPSQCELPYAFLHTVQRWNHRKRNLRSVC